MLLFGKCFIFVDFDECQSNITNNCTCDSGLDAMGCTPQCVNIEASYNCSCSEGFEIGSDPFICTGKFLIACI